MKLSTLCYTLTFLPSLLYAAAASDFEARNATLAKRGGEINYLLDCQSMSSKVNYPVSYMGWYADLDRSLARPAQLPDSMSREYRNWSTGKALGDYLQWEGVENDIYFPGSGVTVQTHIDWDARSRNYQDWAGWLLRTSDWRGFNCYRDNDRLMWYYNPPLPDGSTDRVLACNTRYWCV